jgi:hypothetical protein
MPQRRFSLQDMLFHGRFWYNRLWISASHTDAGWMDTKLDLKHEPSRSSCGLQPSRSAVQRQPSTRLGAIRMSRLRDRRQRGYRCVVLEVCAADIDGLIAHGLLDNRQRDDPSAIERAIGSLLDRLTR